MDRKCFISDFDRLPAATRVIPGQTNGIVYVIDDDAAFRRATGELLEACGYRTLLYSAANHFLQCTLKDEMSCILLDVRMPGLSGPQLQTSLASRHCRIPIIFMTGHEDMPTAVHAIKAGAEDFLIKPVSRKTLLGAIDRAFVQWRSNRARESQAQALRVLLEALTPREYEVFIHLVNGNPHKQIAFKLEISERTVKLHRHEVVRKLGVRSLAELAIIAERLGLLSIPAASVAGTRLPIASRKTAHP
jgi:FixJ family two-component response regulator